MIVNICFGMIMGLWLFLKESFFFKGGLERGWI